MGDLHVFDLPQLYTRPSAEDILDALALLTSAPPSWEGSDVEGTLNRAGQIGKRKSARLTPGKNVRVNPEGVTRYLTGIVSSDLRWIQDDVVKEEIWNQASLRLSERSGRSAMPALDRSFRIPLRTGGEESTEIVIHEPALTGDNLGLKTWASSYLLAKRFSALDLPLSKSDDSNAPRILELGSGTGLVGLAAACVYGASVVLTDLPSIFSNLAHNIRINQDAIEQNGGSVQGGILDWTEPTTCRVFSDTARDPDDSSSALTGRFPVIVAADSLYSAEHPRLLVNTIGTWLSEEAGARVVVEFPLREGYSAERIDFRTRMMGIGLEIVSEGEEFGFDDWGWSGEERSEDEDDNGRVKCWWSIWGRRNRESKDGNPMSS